MARICKFIFGGDSANKNVPGPSVALDAMSEALRNDPSFQDLKEEDIQNLNSDDVIWIENFWDRDKILSLIDKNVRFAIGPNVVFDYSQTPGRTDTEQKMVKYTNYEAIFWQSRWYAELGRKNFSQKVSHHILSCPIPKEWLSRTYSKAQDIDALIYRKGGDTEEKIANQIASLFPKSHIITYRKYKYPGELFEMSSRSKACFYISREDSFSIASLEINLTGCPIISDEKASPVVRHGITGLLVPVREQAPDEPFTWDLDSAFRLADEFDAASSLDRSLIRNATIQAGSAELFRKTVKSVLKL